MDKKKNNNIVLKILSIFFLIYIALFIANLSGYYESKIRENTIVTEEGIKKFEEKIKNGEDIDITSFLSKEREDYSSKMSNLGDKITTNIEGVVVSGTNLFVNIIKSLF